MNKKLLLTVFLVLAIIFSVTVVSASDVNVTDADDNLTADTSEILQSGVSDILSNGSDEDIPTVALESTVKANQVTKYYKASTNYTATFTDNYGKALTNTTVNILVNNISKTVNTDAKGVVSLDIDLTPGTYKIIATNPSNDYQLTTTFKIVSTIKANDLTKVQKDARKFTATFLNSNGKALANTYVKFRINGKTYTSKTDKNGVATLSLASLKAGTYNIISYNADGLTKNNTVKVLSTTTTKLSASSYTFLKKETKKVKVRLLNGLGDAVSGKVIKFLIHGKTYSKKTDSKGYATFKLPNMNTGLYTVKYTFKGDSVYKASSVSKKVAIVLSKKNKVVTIQNILDGASRVKSSYLNNGVVPSKVVTGGYTFTIYEFYYLMSRITNQLSKSKNTQLTAMSGVKAPKSKCTDGVYAAAVTRGKYVSYAKNSVNHIKKNKRVPSYIKGVAGKIAFEDYVYLNSRVLDFYKKNKESPNFVSFISPKKPNYNYKGNNPFGLKGKKVWIDADGGSDAIKWQLASALRKLGWEVHVGDTYANAHYEDYFNAYPGYVVINIYNGFCAGTIRELASDWVQDLLKTKNVVCVPVFHTAGWTNPQGMGPYRYGDFSGYSAKKAWDDNFSIKDPSIRNVGQFLKKNNIKYCASPTCDLIVKQFIKGGYFASL